MPDLYSGPMSGVPPESWRLWWCAVEMLSACGWGCSLPCCADSCLLVSARIDRTSGKLLEDLAFSRPSISASQSSPKPRWVELRYSDRSHPALVCPCSLARWRNWLMLVVVGLEVVQLVSMGLNSSPLLMNRLRQVIPLELADAVQQVADIFF